MVIEGDVRLLGRQSLCLGQLYTLVNQVEAFLIPDQPVLYRTRPGDDKYYLSPADFLPNYL